MGKLKKALYKTIFINNNASPEAILGFKGAYNFIIKHKAKGWTVEDFIENYRQIEQQYAQFVGDDYFESHLYALRLNIEDMGGDVNDK